MIDGSLGSRPVSSIVAIPSKEKKKGPPLLDVIKESRDKDK